MASASARAACRRCGRSLYPSHGTRPRNHDHDRHPGPPGGDRRARHRL